MAQRTPLHDRHVALGANMVEFGGYDMPLQYSSIREEHVAVRERAGIFDLSHMGEVRFRGSGATATVQRLVANDVSRLGDGAAFYAVMCNDAGGIVDDVIVYRMADDDYMVVINAACRDKDVAWMREHLGPATDFADISDETALIAVQGPRALAMVSAMTATPLHDLSPFRFISGPVAAISGQISRTGYTGEDGVELYVTASAAPALWDALLEAGESIDLLPAGLGARDTLRLEAGLRLYGQDMDETTDPFSAGLGWTVKLGAGDFIGVDALRTLDPRNPPRRFVGLAFEGRAIARHGQAVLVDGEAQGEVTSGTYGFTLQRGIATAYVPPGTAANAPLAVDIRGSTTRAERVALPFYRRPAPVTGGR